MNKVNFSKVSSKVLVGFGLLALTALVVASPSSASAATISSQLQVGSRGSEVSTLQTFLAQDVALYPQGLVTGYFGNLTKNAVMNFQLRNELPAVGRVGPMTLPVINYQLVNGMFRGMGMSQTTYPGIYTGADIYAPTISNVAVSTNTSVATVSWNTNEAATGVVHYNTSPLVLSEQLNNVSSNGFTAMTDTALRTSQSVSVSGLQSNTVYYYMIYSTDASGNVSVTWPSTFRTN